MIGRLEIITGPMFAGKTTEMLRRLVALKEAGMSVLYMNHVGDTRVTEYKFTTHAESIVDGSDAVPPMAITSLPDVDKIVGYDVVAFDEAHWYADLSVVNDYVDNGLYVIVCGLHSNTELEVLGKLRTLLPRADDVTFLKAYCSVCWEKYRTKADATFPWRYNPNPNTWVGEAEQYKVVCRSHHPSSQ